MDKPVRSFVYMRWRARFMILNCSNWAAFIFWRTFCWLLTKGIKVFAIFTHSVLHRSKNLVKRSWPQIKRRLTAVCQSSGSQLSMSTAVSNVSKSYNIAIVINNINTFYVSPWSVAFITLSWGFRTGLLYWWLFGLYRRCVSRKAYSEYSRQKRHFHGWRYQRRFAPLYPCFGKKKPLFLPEHWYTFSCTCSIYWRVQ